MANKKGSEYGKPTFGRAVAARVGVGDGYGNAKTAPKAKPAERLTLSNASTKLPETLAKRRAALDEYKNGGKVRRKKC